MQYASFFKLIIKSMLCAALFSGSIHTMNQSQVAIGFMNTMNTVCPGLLQTAAMGAACGGTLPFVGGVFSSTCGGRNKGDFFQSTLCGAGAGSLLGMAFYVASCPFVTGNVSGFIAPKVAKLFTVASSLVVGILITLQTDRK